MSITLPLENFWQWHFILLLVALLAGFIALGVAQFGAVREEFSSPGKLFEALWDILIGGVLDSGDLASDAWTNNALMTIYLIVYNFISFMFMLNFIIAIICQCYIKVVQSVVDMEADQEFFTDCTSIVIVSAKSFYFQWPPHKKLVRALRTLETNYCGYVELRVLFPELSTRTMQSFMTHYRRYEPIARRVKRQSTPFEEALRDNLTKISVMLGVSVPPIHDAICEARKLQKKGYRQVKHDLNEKDQMFLHQVFFSYF